MTEEKLLELKKTIDQASEKIAKLEGRRSALKEQLSEKFKVSTLKEAKVKAKAMQEKIDTLNKEIEIMSSKLEKQLNEQNTGTTN